LNFQIKPDKVWSWEKIQAVVGKLGKKLMLRIKVIVKLNSNFDKPTISAARVFLCGAYAIYFFELKFKLKYDTIYVYVCDSQRYLIDQLTLFTLTRFIVDSADSR
jgi:hypothetical protein